MTGCSTTDNMQLRWRNKGESDISSLSLREEAREEVTPFPRPPLSRPSLGENRSLTLSLLFFYHRTGRVGVIPSCEYAGIIRSRWIELGRGRKEGGSSLKLFSSTTSPSSFCHPFHQQPETSQSPRELLSVEESLSLLEKKTKHLSPASLSSSEETLSVERTPLGPTASVERRERAGRGLRRWKSSQRIEGSGEELRRVRSTAG